MLKKLHEPYQKLKGILREKNLTYRNIGDLINVSETCVSHKINGESDFFIGEVKLITKEHGIGVDFFC